MSIVPLESERFSNMERVADLTMQGENPTAIAKQLGIPRKEVMALVDDYRAALSNDTEARDMARDHLNMMGKHYDRLIKKFYELIEEINLLDFNHQVAAQKNAALKAIGELEAKRLDAFQKAGLLDSAELGDELAEAEEKQAIIIEILRHDLCPECQAKVAHKLSKLSGRVEVVQVFDEDPDA